MLLVGELFISWICPDAYVVGSSAVGFVAAHGLATAYVQGCEAFSLLFNVQLLLELFLDIAVPVIVRRVHEEQVAAYHQSKDAESLVLLGGDLAKGGGGEGGGWGAAREQLVDRTNYYFFCFTLWFYSHLVIV